MEILRSYFDRDDNYISKHQIDSYDEFLFRDIPRVIKDLNPFVISDNKKVHIDVNTLSYEKSCDQTGNPVTPAMCREKALSYNVSVFADIKLDVKTNGSTDSSLLENFKICTLPAMLHSSACYLKDLPPAERNSIGECIYDKGGYFIIDGKEKVLVSRERIIPNMLYTSKPSKNESSKYYIQGECRSVAEAGFPKVLKLFITKTNKWIVASLKRLSLEDLSLIHI